ncbi:arabinogalactan oligomer / maltooligosaccharide transport system permease protein [Lachnospiraceae bacterium C10]|jgi:arabinogalactan oligomer/maltooligosaccharide transport system permease protein|nr:arabinogalactan oligomer / maltooligosaccharide transport system permease protein [Lachnospiraceae bacterium C10]SDW72336.1 arabinogalactan oligomer / maltooligosaccharide transport system permease protein [Lachnospiraceae bacterium KHCPX20]
MKTKWNQWNCFIHKSSWAVKLSMVIMGAGHFRYGGIAKGLIYLLMEISMIVYAVRRGISDIVGFFTLGTQTADAWSGIEGDNSIVMLIMGIFAWILVLAFLYFYVKNVKGAYAMQLRHEQGLAQIGWKKELASLFDQKFYVLVLALPVLGVCIFNILPIVFMILIAFTNYGGKIVPPHLVDWVGFANFKKLLVLSKFAPTFGRILSWNLLWAVVSTALNYFAGLGLALLLNKECVKGKAFWRAFPILAYAIPGFITLLAFKFMFSYGGPINQMIMANGGEAFGFLDLDARWSARCIGLLVNCWISVPSIMLLATGHLSNRDVSLYEAAKMDGAGRWKQFWKLTMPYMIFATTPVLLGQFIGNFNNFGIFYFLRGGLYMDGYFLASDTDLLINWLYNLSIDNNYYSIGAAISLIIFLITSTISLIVYVKSPSYREEDTFQ